MKKITITLLLISVFYIFVSEGMAKTLEIPEDAIRIRIVPNSNSSEDQKVKSKVKDKLEVTMYNMLKEAESSNEARKIIKGNITTIEKDVVQVLKKESYNKNYMVDFGYHYFPEKEYKGIKYKEGYYESLLITLGEGKGDNWWCVLFPPLCLIEADKNTDIEYKSFVKELINKYLGS